MTQNTAYCIMILSPVLFSISKLSIHYEIVYKIIRKRHSKTYIRKNKGNLIQNFFLYRYKNEMSIFFYVLNATIGIVLVIGVVLAIIYSILAFLKYELKSFLVPYITMYVDMFLIICRSLRFVYEL